MVCILQELIGKASVQLVSSGQWLDKALQKTPAPNNTETSGSTEFSQKRILLCLSLHPSELLGPMCAPLRVARAHMSAVVVVLYSLPHANVKTINTCLLENTPYGQQPLEASQPLPLKHLLVSSCPPTLPEC